MAAGLGALLGLAACSSPTPARYYTLQRPAGSAPVDAAVRTTGAVPAQASAAPAPAAVSGNARFALQVLPVRVPPICLVTREDRALSPAAAQFRRQLLGTG